MLTSYNLMNKLNDCSNKNIDVITTSTNLSGTIVEIGKDYIVLESESKKYILNVNQIIYFNER